MPTSPNLRAQLQDAAAYCRTGGEPAPHLADAITQVLRPGGWKQLRDVDETSAGSNLAIRMAESYRDQIRDAVDRLPTAVTITSLVNEGFERFLAGDFQPRERTTRNRRIVGQKMVNLNVKPKASLHNAVRDSDVLPMYVAADYLMSLFNIGPYSAARVESLPSGVDRKPRLPRGLRDALRDGAASLGRVVHDDMNEGFEKYLAGEYEPPVLEWPEGADMAVLTVRPNDELFDKVRFKTRNSPELNPIRIGISYAMEKYGIDPAATL
ncbi:hypothetical protein ACFVG1_12955 [Streptomyces bacillaris]|uniref:hypothetical protein n=1 Tax=Streptomyces bacillaris TaxID=68179 RepID=UPI0035D89335